jgi:pantetheine-phosphate adenylyltransferase
MSIGIQDGDEQEVRLFEETLLSPAYGEISQQHHPGILTIDFARKMEARAIVRGLRAMTDFENEFQMAIMNKKLAPDCEVVCLMSSLNFQFLSASLLKEVANLGGDIDDLVPKPVLEALRKRIILRSSSLKKF